ncbi:MAG: transglutaminase-like domain-containing protein, partial [Chloroflexota bacterium]
MTNQSLLAYYKKHSVITNPKGFAGLLDDCPADPVTLAKITQGLILHNLTGSVYDLKLTKIQREDYLTLRSVERILERISSIDDAPLDQPRDPADRVVGNCRTFATLFVALCRQKGIPARLRVGFATYFRPPEILKDDHWVAEYWDGSRWVLIDPQIDAAQYLAMGMSHNVMDMVDGKDFYTAGAAWQLSRTKEVDSRTFGFTKRMCGLPFIKGNLLFDLFALNKIELLPWDRWGPLIRKSEKEMTAADMQLLDQIAELTTAADGNFDHVQAIYQSLQDAKVIETRLASFGVGDEMEVGDPDLPIGSTQPVNPQMHTWDLKTDNLERTTFNGQFGVGDIIITGAR